MPNASPHILVIDDNEEILQSLLLMLQRKAFRVSTKSRMHDFKQEVEALDPNLILLDKTLGWADGCDLCKFIKADKNLLHIPVVMFSAYYKKKEECMEAGANGFLEKPFEMKELIHVVTSLTENSHS